MPALPELFHFRVSHFNEKVRWALDHKGIPHRRTALTPALHLPRVRWMTGQSRVPVLVLDGEVIHDSTRIIAALEARHPDPPLYPGDPAERQRALGIEDHFDEVVAPDLRRLFWSTYLDDGAACARLAADGATWAAWATWRVAFPVLGPALRRNVGLHWEELAALRARLDEHLDHLASLVGPSGFLVGDRFGVADLTAAAVMTAILRPPEFSYPLPEPWPDALVAMRASIVDHPASQWVLDVYRHHRGESAEVRAPGSEFG